MRGFQTQEGVEGQGWGGNRRWQEGNMESQKSFPKSLGSCYLHRRHILTIPAVAEEDKRKFMGHNVPTSQPNNDVNENGGVYGGRRIACPTDEQAP